MFYYKETFINATENHLIGEPMGLTEFDGNKGDLYRYLQREYGRCISKMYVDREDGGAQVIGWVFQSRDKYTDCNETYLREVWVEVHTAKPKVVNHLADLEKI